MAVIGAESLDLLQKDFEKVCVICLTSAGAGKTHVANALCIAAMHQMKTVKYIRANTLINECLKLRPDSKGYLDYLNHMAGFSLLVIDDFGLMPLERKNLKLIRLSDGETAKMQCYRLLCLSR
ncbi:MAG TPA: ATP-binding protein [Lachnospiraceae bacterium]|nr:ATP-binding protein [Lachnospiraceae bacterium]